MTYRTNSKIPPLQQNSRSNNFSLSFKSKTRPFVLSHSKPLNHQEIEQESESESQVENPKVFPVEVYKDMLKGQKIYLEMYYRDQLYQSGYEPYIIAMGGQVVKRVCPSTTVVLTGLMSRDKYNKLKAKVNKICKPSTCILSIIWLQEIYRQKRKVQKQKYLFDEKVDIIDNPDDSDDNDSMPDYFQREIFEIDINQDLEKYVKKCDQQLVFKIEENKKFRDKLGEDFLDIIEPQKYELFSQFDEDHFKILKNRKGYKYFWPQNKEKQKKKNKSGNSVGLKKPPTEKEKKPRVSMVKKSQKEKKELRKTQVRIRSDSFDDSSFKVDKKDVRETLLQRKTIDKSEIQNYRQQQQNLYIPMKTSLKKSDRMKESERKSQNYENQSKKLFNEDEKPPQKKFTDIGQLRPEPPRKSKNNSKGATTSDKGQQSEADFIKRRRQKKDDEDIDTKWKNMLSKSRINSQNVTRSRLQTSNQSNSVSQPSVSTTPKSQSEVSQKTITAPKHSKYHR